MDEGERKGKGNGKKEGLLFVPLSKTTVQLFVKEKRFLCELSDIEKYPDSLLYEKLSKKKIILLNEDPCHFPTICKFLRYGEEALWCCEELKGGFMELKQLELLGRYLNLPNFHFKQCVNCHEWYHPSDTISPCIYHPGQYEWDINVSTQEVPCPNEGKPIESRLGCTYCGKHKETDKKTATTTHQTCQFDSVSHLKRWSCCNQSQPTARGCMEGGGRKEREREREREGEGERRGGRRGHSQILGVFDVWGGGGRKSYWVGESKKEKSRYEYYKGLKRKGELERGVL